MPTVRIVANAILTIIIGLLAKFIEGDNYQKIKNISSRFWAECSGTERYHQKVIGNNNRCGGWRWFSDHNFNGCDMPDRRMNGGYNNDY